MREHTLSVYQYAPNNVYNEVYNSCLESSGYSSAEDDECTRLTKEAAESTKERLALMLGITRNP